MDVFSREKRSEIMSRVSGKNTRPELVVRSLLHQLGFRFRLHRADLPGKPDIVLPGRKKAIFVHGCFWHGHQGCARSRRPSSNESFWSAKLDKNIMRDKVNLVALESLGWRVKVLWTCEIRDLVGLQEDLISFLENKIDGRQL